MNPMDMPVGTPSTDTAIGIASNAEETTWVQRTRLSRGTRVLSRIAASTVFLCTAATALAQVTAAGVVDRPTLRAFVERANAHSKAAVSNATDQGAFGFFDREFRHVGPWRHGSIYLAVLDAEGADRGRFLFHATRSDLEGENVWDFEDKNGVLVTQEFVAKAGRDFVEYYFDDPSVVGDEEEGSFKIGYADNLEIRGHRYLIISGYYPATSIAIAPPLVLLLQAAPLAAGGGYLHSRRRGLTGLGSCRGPMSSRA